MAEMHDLELNRSASDDTVPPVRPSRPKWPIIVIVLVAVAAGIGYFALRRSAPETAAVEQPAPAATEQTQDIPLVSGMNIPLPPLAETDPLVRDLVSKLSSHPKVAAWLTTDRLVSNFTVVALNIADGQEPTVHLRKVAPDAPFRTMEAGGRTVIDPASYDRYDAYADAIGGLDAAGTARLYLTLKPRITDAYRELGHPEGDFDRVLERAIARLLAVPVVEGDIPVREEVVTYAYADPRLESMSGPQKHLLRMGPRNVRIIQAKLAEIATQLGLQPQTD